jgi:glycosyltransferase involved in cell wall biosynthesis
MRDLLITTHTPVLGSGRAMRTYAIARALAEHRGLDVLYVRFGASQPDRGFASIPGIALHEMVPSRGTRRLASYTAALLAGVPSAFARGVSSELSRAATQLSAVGERGRVIADGPIAAAALRGLARARPVIYNAHNFESGFRDELIEGGGARLHGLRSFERGLLERASESWMVSAADMRAARQLCPEATLRRVPNVVDVATIEPVSPAVPPQQRAVFVANFAYEPNRTALRFLLEEVFIRIWEQLPEARLSLVGPGLEQIPSDDPRVQALGFVEELASVYACCDCAVVPLLQGGGSPLKLIEALAYGMPTIATSRAIAGLDGAIAGEHLLVADDPDAFAQATLAVLGGGEQRLAQTGRRLVQEHYSIEALSMLLAPASSASPLTDGPDSDDSSPA